jgi:hypothetical protein
MSSAKIITSHTTTLIMEDWKKRLAEYSKVQLVPYDETVLRLLVDCLIDRLDLRYTRDED